MAPLSSSSLRVATWGMTDEPGLTRPPWASELTGVGAAVCWRFSGMSMAKEAREKGAREGKGGQGRAESWWLGETRGRVVRPVPSPGGTRLA